MQILRLAVALMALGSCFLVGCGTPKPKPRPWNITVNKTTPASIEVDLIGVNEIERAAWEGYDLDKYWTPGDLRRSNADKVTLTLQTGKPETISRDDARWRHWLDRGATELLVIANLPGSHFPAGPSDPRRVFLPLDKNAWKAQGGNLKIEVEDTMIHVVTPQNQRR